MATNERRVYFQQSDMGREPREGWVVRTGPGREVWVDFPGNGAGPLKARISPTFDVRAIHQMACARPPALLMFAEGDPTRPVLVMLMEPPSETPLTDQVLAEPISQVPVEARVDGQRVVLSGQREVVLECGKASLTLRSNGEVVLRGVNVLTEADGVQRIRGRKVRIN